MKTHPKNDHKENERYLLKLEKLVVPVYLWHLSDFDNSNRMNCKLIGYIYLVKMKHSY